MSSHTKFQLQIMFLTLDIDPTTPNKDLYHTPQNRSTVDIDPSDSDYNIFFYMLLWRPQIDSSHYNSHSPTCRGTT